MSILDAFDTRKPEGKTLALGTISRIDGDDVYAIIPAFNRKHEHGPMPFEHAADAEVRDAVLIGFDEDGQPWVVAWDGVAVGGSGGATGDAGGVLAGTYPNPSFAADMATQAELDTVSGAQTTHAALTTAAHGGIVSSGDSRLTDARTPTAHASTHIAIGSDPLTLSQSQITNLTSDLALKAPLASPTFTGSPAAPTPAVDNNTTLIATTAYVIAQASSSTPIMDGTGAVGTSKKWSRDDHVHPTDTSRLAATAAAGGDLTGNYPNPTIDTGKVTNAKLVSAAGTLADMPPGRELTYTEKTSGTTISSTTEAGADVIVTSAAFTYDGSTPVYIEAWFADASAIGAWSLSLVLWDDTAGASIGLFGSTTLAAGAASGPIFVRRKITPASGSRTYSLRGFRGTANGTVNAGAGGSGTKMPAWIRIVKA